MANDFQTLTGCGVALITPFKHNGDIDFDSLKGIIDFVVKEGVDYIVSLGSTGESATLSDEEQSAILQFTIETVNKRLPIVAGGFGSNNTKALIKKVKSSALDGITAILSNTPAYNKPNQEGLFLHYRALASATTLPIILYNVPGRTASSLENDTLLKILKETNRFIGIKDARANIPLASEIIYNKPENFAFISGDDPTCLATTLLGGQGVISVIANAYPKTFSAMIHAAMTGNSKQATQLNAKLFSMHDLLYVDGNPSGIKSLMAKKGLCDPYLRLPLSPVSYATQKLIEELYIQIGLNA